MAAMLVGIGGAGFWNDTKITANAGRITESEKDIVRVVTTLEAWTDDLDELKEMLGEAMSEMRAYHSER